MEQIRHACSCYRLPPERDLEWTKQVLKVHFGLCRKFEMAQKTDASGRDFNPEETKLSNQDETLLRALHTAIHSIEKDIDRFAFNRCVAHLHVLVTAISNYKGEKQHNKAIRSYALRHLAILLSPFSPHISEEIWKITCADGLVSQADWPQTDNKWFVTDEVEVAVQVNGKLRATLLLPVDCDRQKAETDALNLDAVKKYLNNQSPKRVIVVPNRIVNVVC